MVKRFRLVRRDNWHLFMPIINNKLQFTDLVYINDLGKFVDIWDLKKQKQPLNQ